MQNRERIRLRMDSIRDILVDYCGNRVRNIREVPSLAVWQAYELMKEGVSPEGIRFYLMLTYPADFNNRVLSNSLDSTLRQAHEEYVGSGHLTKYEVPSVDMSQRKN